MPNGRKIKNTLPKGKISLLNNFFFDPISARDIKLTRELCSQLKGKKGKGSRLSKVELGCFGRRVFRSFGSSYLNVPFELDQEYAAGSLPTITFYSKTPQQQWSSIHTRQIDVDTTIAPNFELVVKESQIRPYVRTYILVTFCLSTGYGYCLGWVTYNELNARPVGEWSNQKFKAIPVTDLHPMMDLQDYLEHES